MENFCWGLVRLLEGFERRACLLYGGDNHNKLDTMRLPETLVWAALFFHEVRHAE